MSTHLCRNLNSEWTLPWNDISVNEYTNTSHYISSHSITSQDMYSILTCTLHHMMMHALTLHGWTSQYIGPTSHYISSHSITSHDMSHHITSHHITAPSFIPFSFFRWDPSQPILHPHQAMRSYFKTVLDVCVWSLSVCVWWDMSCDVMECDEM